MSDLCDPGYEQCVELRESIASWRKLAEDRGQVLEDAIAHMKAETDRAEAAELRLKLADCALRQIEHALKRAGEPGSSISAGPWAEYALGEIRAALQSTEPGQCSLPDHSSTVKGA